MNPTDKAIWVKSYYQKYSGLEKLDTQEIITEEEYKAIKHLVKKTLPTLGIATIKKDRMRHATRAKYCIVSLGNLDPHDWTKQQSFAQVLSQQELWLLLLSLEAKKRCIPQLLNWILEQLPQC